MEKKRALKEEKEEEKKKKKEERKRNKEKSMLFKEYLKLHMIATFYSSLKCTIVS